MIKAFKFLASLIFGVEIYTAPTDEPAAGKLRLEHFYSAEYRHDLTHRIPIF